MLELAEKDALSRQLIALVNVTAQETIAAPQTASAAGDTTRSVWHRNNVTIRLRSSAGAHPHKLELEKNCFRIADQLVVYYFVSKPGSLLRFGFYCNLISDCRSADRARTSPNSQPYCVFERQCSFIPLRLIHFNFVQLVNSGAVAGRSSFGCRLTFASCSLPIVQSR